MNPNHILVRPFQKNNHATWLHESLQPLHRGTEGACGSPDPFECQMLWQNALKCKGNVIEIGSWRGRSTCFLAKGVKDSQLPNRKVYAIDWFQGDDTGGKNPDQAELRKSLKKFDLDEYVEVIDHDMLTFDYSTIDNVDLVFYDSNHKKEPTVEALTKLHPYINDRCKIFLHDAIFDVSTFAKENRRLGYKKFKDNQEGTVEAINELEDAGLFEHIVTFWCWEGFGLLMKVKK